MRTDRLRALTAEERHVLTLRLSRRFTAEEIATQLGKPPEEVLAIIRSALLRLARTDAQTGPRLRQAPNIPLGEDPA